MKKLVKESFEEFLVGEKAEITFQTDGTSVIEIKDATAQKPDVIISSGPEKVIIEGDLEVRGNIQVFDDDGTTVLFEVSKDGDIKTNVETKSFG